MKSILVTGNARSGTSMTGGLLSILGVDMGEIPVEDMKDNHITQNLKGSFENPDFTKLTSDMLKDAKDGMGNIAINDKYDRIIQNTIVANQNPLWGFKSAAVPIFMPSFAKHMTNPYIVIVLRNILHNAQSWIIHMKDVYGTNVDLNKALKVTADAQNAMLITAIRMPEPKMFLTYEAIKKDSWKEDKRLAEFIGVDPEGKEEEVKEFIMPNHTTLDIS